MVDSLLRLERSIRSKEMSYLKEKITSEELDALLTYKANALRQLAIGAVSGGGTTWFALGTMGSFLRIGCTGVAAYVHGMMRFYKSLDSSIGHILGLDGTLMQRELAAIMLVKYEKNPTASSLLCKCLYFENVFDDSTSGSPKIGARFRNNFDDEMPYIETGHYVRSSENINLEPKPSSMSSGFDPMANPFECIFGLPPKVEETYPLVSSGTLPRRHSRKHRRSQRRHQMHDEEVPTTSQI